MSVHTTAARTDWSEELKTAAVIYRQQEQARYRAAGFEVRMRQRLAEDPMLNQEVRAAWSGVEADIHDRFRSMIPKTKSDRDKGPKVFEVHHEIAVGKECFLLRLDETGSAADAAAFTRNRLALTGDPSEFYAAYGSLAEAEPGPEPV